MRYRSLWVNEKRPLEKYSDIIIKTFRNIFFIFHSDVILPLLSLSIDQKVVAKRDLSDKDIKLRYSH